jgi:HEAT repeat protein
MSATEELKKIVDEFPAEIARDKEKVEAATAGIAKGGKQSVLGLISLLAEPGGAADAKPHFALHCVVNYPLVVRDEALRKEICQAIASQLENNALLPENRAYLCQELQWAGRDEACEPLGRVLLDEAVTDAATAALVAIGGERAIVQFRAALPRATGRPRLNVLGALAVLADARSAEAFTQALGDMDREVRLAAADGLGRLGRPESAALLIAAADGAQGWERTQMTKACLVLAEKLAASGNKPAARSIYGHLRRTRTTKAELHVRDAAMQGLAALA